MSSVVHSSLTHFLLLSSRPKGVGGECWVTEEAEWLREWRTLATGVTPVKSRVSPPNFRSLRRSLLVSPYSALSHVFHLLLMSVPDARRDRGRSGTGGTDMRGERRVGTTRERGTSWRETVPTAFHGSSRSFLVSPPFGRLVSYGTEPYAERT